MNTTVRLLQGKTGILLKWSRTWEGKDIKNVLDATASIISGYDTWIKDEDLNAVWANLIDHADNEQQPR